MLTEPATNNRAETLNLARQALRWVSDQQLTTVIITDLDFKRFALGANEIGLPLSEQLQFCWSQWCYKPHLEHRLQISDPNNCDNIENFFELFTRLGWERRVGRKKHDIWRRIRNCADGYGWLSEYDAKRACGIRGSDRLSRQKEKLYEQAIETGDIIRERKIIGRGYRVRAVDLGNQ